jgi:hypothetical protein
MVHMQQAADVLSGRPERLAGGAVAGTLQRPRSTPETQGSGHLSQSRQLVKLGPYLLAIPHLIGERKLAEAKFD